MPLLVLMDGRLGSQASLHPPHPHVQETSTSPTAFLLLSCGAQGLFNYRRHGNHLHASGSWHALAMCLESSRGVLGKVPSSCIVFVFFFLEIPMSIQFLLKTGMVEKPQSEVWPLSRF